MLLGLNIRKYTIKFKYLQLINKIFFYILL